MSAMLAQSSEDDFDEHDDDVLQLADDALAHALPLAPNQSSTAQRIVRKRSSKACDNCRKAKCKCERSPSEIANGDPCRSCVALGAECTFLGPSRKRGPPKGYIDALESKLHQTEALLGTIIASNDPRARALVAHLSQDTLAAEIIQRVDDSQYGSRARKQAAATKQLYNDSAAPQPSSSKKRDASRSTTDGNRHGFSGPPHEWQESLDALIGASKLDPTASSRFDSPSSFSNPEDVKPSISKYASDPVNPHQRRRIDHASSASPVHRPESDRGHPDIGRVASSSTLATRPQHSASPPDVRAGSSSLDDEHDEGNESDLADAMGQLSVNDVHQVRYHGKTAGLHFLTPAMETDPAALDSSSSRATRFHGGLWKFPPAGVWPAPPPQEQSKFVQDADADMRVDAAASQHLPDIAKQEHFVQLFFDYVHPILPLVNKRSFLRDFEIRKNPSHPDHAASLIRIPNFLLFAMFSVAERYSTDTPPVDDGTLWTAGEFYFNQAKALMFSYASLSRVILIQSVLLMCYRDIGIGAMAHAYMLMGLSLRVGLDLGLNRSLSKWETNGQPLFSQEEKELRSRVWYCIVRMDRYLATYIGRPIGIQERDYDTTLPEEIDNEDDELWDSHPSIPNVSPDERRPPERIPLPCRTISCFRASIQLSRILGTIVANQYAIRLPSTAFRRHERLIAEVKLDKWMLELPDHLRWDARAPAATSPHILTLHLQYWCTVLLLNRPFIRVRNHRPSGTSTPTSLEGDEESLALAAKAFATCQTAAHNMTKVATAFAESFCIRRAPALLCYYLFSAAIMHVTSLVENPQDVPAMVAFQNTFGVLKKMAIVWPSASRACDVLSGVRVNLHHEQIAQIANAPKRNKKRSVETLNADVSARRPVVPPLPQERVNPPRGVERNEWLGPTTQNPVAAEIAFASDAITRGTAPMSQLFSVDAFSQFQVNRLMPSAPAVQDQWRGTNDNALPVQVSATSISAAMGSNGASPMYGVSAMPTSDAPYSYHKENHVSAPPPLQNSYHSMASSLSHPRVGDYDEATALWAYYQQVGSASFATPFQFPSRQGQPLVPETTPTDNTSAGQMHPYVGGVSAYANYYGGP